MSSPAVELLASLRTALERLGIRWYLFGAQAVIAYGAPRLTADADVTVDLGQVAAAKLVNELEREGFRLRVGNVDAFVERTRVLPFVHDPSGVPLDVVLAGPGLEELFLDRARQLRFGAVQIPVIAPEDLVALKILAGRPQDLLDASSVLRARAQDIDVDMVRSTLHLLERALDRSDLLPELERRLQAAKKGRG
jgi:hypothetical protein